MTQHTRFLAAACALALGTLAGCGGGGSDDVATTTPPAAPPAAPSNPDFTVFVKALQTVTSETSPPIQVDTVTFDFKDEDNATAYNDILPP